MHSSDREIIFAPEKCCARGSEKGNRCTHNARAMVGIFGLCVYHIGVLMVEGDIMVFKGRARQRIELDQIPKYIKPIGEHLRQERKYKHYIGRTVYGKTVGRPRIEDEISPEDKAEMRRKQKRDSARRRYAAMTPEEKAARLEKKRPQARAYYQRKREEAGKEYKPLLALRV